MYCLFAKKRAQKSCEIVYLNIFMIPRSVGCESVLAVISDPTYTVVSHIHSFPSNATIVWSGATKCEERLPRTRHQGTGSGAGPQVL